jgi:TP901 family phage tail tape measure protein
MGKANAQIEITASTSKLAAGLAVAAAKFKAFGGAVARGMGAGLKGLNKKLQPGETMKRAVGNFGGDMMGRGLDMFVDAAAGVREFESNLQRLGQVTHKSPAEIDALGKSLRATSVATSISSAEMMNAAGIYFDLTSDTAGMTKAMDVFAKTSQASGAGMEDLVRTAAALKDSMGIGADEMESVFSGLITQGEAGKITLKELGGEAPSLLAMFSKFGTGRSGVMQMNAAFQTGAKAFGSASQAATGLEAMMGMLQARQGQLKKEGVNVFKVNKDGTVVLNNLADIVSQIGDKKIDPRKWGKVFGENKEGRGFLEMLLKMPGTYDDILKAGEATGTVQEYAFNRAESKAGRLDLALNRMKESIAGAFTPERIEGFVKAVENLAEKMGPVVDMVGKIGGFLGGMQGIGESIRGVFTETNPYAEDAARVSMAGGPGGARNWGLSDEDAAKQKAKDQISLDKAAAFGKTRDSIMGGEINERMSPESKRRAVLASYQGDTRDGGRNSTAADDATRLAGSQYLGAAKITPAEQKEIFGKALAEEISKVASSEIGAAIIEGFKQTATNLTIGDNQVSKAADRSTEARRGTH